MAGVAEETYVGNLYVYNAGMSGNLFGEITPPDAPKKVMDPHDKYYGNQMLTAGMIAALRSAGYTVTVTPIPSSQTMTEYSTLPLIAPGDTQYVIGEGGYFSKYLMRIEPPVKEVEVDLWSQKSGPDRTRTSDWDPTFTGIRSDWSEF